MYTSTTSKDPFLGLFRESLQMAEYRNFFRRYPVGVSWMLTGEVLLRDLINSNQSPEKKIHTLQDTLLFSVDQEDRELQELSFHCWREYFEKMGWGLASLPDSMQESELCLGRKSFCWNNRRYSLDFFSKLNLTLEIKRTLGENTRPEVLEIGAGYGQLARLVKLAYPEGRYTIVDLPETLYFSSNYLSLNFPNARHVWVRTASQLHDALRNRDFDFLYVPAPLSVALQKTHYKFDAAINKSSFGEMNQKSCAYYVNLIQEHLSVKYLFLLNRFLNVMDPDLQAYRRNENQWYNQLDSQWKFSRWEIEPEFTRFPYNEVLHHRELFLIAERTHSPTIPNPIDDILRQKWNESFTRIPFARHSSIVAVDLGKGSVLERLVNYVRLAPTEKALDALIRYLYLLEGKFPLEERFYYCAMFKKLFHKRHFLSSANPLRQYHLIKWCLSVLGVNFFLKRPEIVAAVLQGIRRIGINPAGTYHFLKAVLFKEKKHDAPEGSEATYIIPHKTTATVNGA